MGSKAFTKVSPIKTGINQLIITEKNKRANQWVALSTFICILGVFPFLFAAAHVHPLSYHEWDWLAAYAIELGTADYWDIQNYFYNYIGGRFFSTAILGSLPLWYDLTTFRLVVIAVVLLFFSSVFLFLKHLELKRFGVFLASLICLLYLHQLSNCYDSLLRFTCMPIYQLGQVALFMGGGLLYSLYHNQYQNWPQLIILSVLCLIASGTNEIVLIQLLLCLLACFFLSYYQTPSSLRLLLPLAFLVLGSVFAIKAPGNFIRMEAYSSNSSIFEAVGLTAGISIFLWTDWLLDSLLLPLIIVVGFSYLKYFPRLNSTLFSKPGLWLVALVIFCPASLFPLVYASGGDSLPERIVDLLYLNACLITTGFSLSWLNTYVRPSKEMIPFNSLTNLAVSIVVLFMVGQLFFSGLGIDHSEGKREHWLSVVLIDANIGQAYLQMMKGIPQKYDVERRAIEERVKNCETTTCLVPGLTTAEFIGYDPLYDRLNRGGDIGMPAYLNAKATKVIYDNK